MILGNVNDGNRCRRVVSLTTKVRRFPVDLPGWDKPGDVESLLPIPAGLTGYVKVVESLGMNPWTRYMIQFDDGTWSNGLVDGQDFAWAD